MKLSVAATVRQIYLETDAPAASDLDSQATYIDNASAQIYVIFEAESLPARQEVKMQRFCPRVVGCELSTPMS